MGDLSGITKLFAMELRQRIGRICIDFDKVYEFRLRVNNPLIIVVENKEFYISKNSNEGLTTAKNLGKQLNTYQIIRYMLSKMKSDRGL